MMLELLGYAFIQRAILAGVLIAITTGLIGVFLVQKKMSLLGDGLAHAAFAGIALGFLFNLNPFLTAIVTAIIASLGIFVLVERTNAQGDAAIAIILSAGMAVAITIIGYAKAFNANLFSYLFGSILAVSPEDILLLACLAVATIIIVFFMRKQLLLVILNEDMARLNGINVRLVNAALIVLSAVTVVVAIRAVGILLVTGLIVIPALISFSLAKSFKQSILLSVLTSVLGVLMGTLIAFALDLPPSGIIILTLLAMLGISISAKKK